MTAQENGQISMRLVHFSLPGDIGGEPTEL
jgi:hypothetical protein